MKDNSFFERLKQEMQIGDILYYGDEVEAKDMLTEKIDGYIRTGDIDESQAEELFSMIDYAIEMAKERKSKENVVKKENYPNLPRFVVEPVTLEDRRSRANYWRLNNAFQLVMDTATGKNHKFGVLWEEYAKTNDEQKRLEIVEQMEKMYPTTTKMLRQADAREGKSKR